MPKIVLDNVTGGQDLSKINSNFQKIATELNDKVLYRDNYIINPNTMENPLDMNGQPIMNLPVPVRPSDPARLQDVQNAVADPTAAHLTSFVPYGVLEATNVQHAIQEIHDLIPGISEATPTLEALAVSVNLLDERTDEVEADIAVLEATLATVAQDVNLVHKTGNETISGVKGFVSSPTVPTPSAADASTKVPNTSWVQGNFVNSTGNETIYGVKTFASPPLGIQLPSVLGAVGTYMICHYAVNAPLTLTSTKYLSGTSVAGTDLRYDTTYDMGNVRHTSANPAISRVFDAGGTALTGTWRRMASHTISTAEDDGNYTSTWQPCLFLRIS